jgi:hypothetical protein
MRAAHFFIKSSARNSAHVKAIALKKDWSYTVFFCLQEMGVLRCDVCGEEFVIGHSPPVADRTTAERQAYWLEKMLAEDHEREKKHAQRIELPDGAALAWGCNGQEKRPA